MPSVKELIEAASFLPVEERAFLVESLQKTLNSSMPDIDRAWVETARRRLSDIREGRVNAIPGERVFAGIQARFSK